MKLTRLGEIAVAHGVMTSPRWYEREVKDADRHAEDGGDPIELLNERIAGLTALRDDWWLVVNDAPCGEDI